MAEYQERRGHRDLKVFQLAYKLAMEIFNESKSFSKDERFSLTDQTRRSSRSVAANIAEGFRKRQYPKMFVSKLADSDGEVAETQVWLDFARDCGYLPEKRHDELVKGYEEVGRMLGSMMSRPEKFRRALNAVNNNLQAAFRFLPSVSQHSTTPAKSPPDL